MTKQPHTPQHQNDRSLSLSFREVLELQPADLAALATLGRLTSLSLTNVCIQSGSDLQPLASGLPGLRALRLNQNSKVAPLLAGDDALAVIGGMVQLEELDLQGRMCAVGDAGLLALRPLTRLRRLAIGWVPWQSQVSQGAVLQLLSGLPLLRDLLLSGAEILLPAAASGAGGGAAAAVIAGLQQQASGAAAAAPQQQDAARPLPQGPLFEPAGRQPGAAPRPQLVSMASAPVLGAAAPQSHQRARALSAAREAAANANAHIRGAVAAALAHITDVKLRFNCCGTGVEKSLLALGPQLRAQLRGLEWSYGKLGGPLCLKLLGSCVNLRSLKIQMWYQDYHQAPTVLDLTALSGLRHLEALSIDKRPPFQQSLPAQQAQTLCPLTPAGLRLLAAAWPRLEALDLGLARADYHPGSLDCLASFRSLRELSLRSYDCGWAEGPCSLLLDVACLPAGLTKLDLLHVDLTLDSGAPCPGVVLQRGEPGTAAPPAPLLAGVCSAAAPPPLRPAPSGAARAPLPPAPAGKCGGAGRGCSYAGAAAAAQGSEAGGCRHRPSEAGGCGASAGGAPPKYNPYAQIWAASHAGVNVGEQAPAGAGQISSWGSGLVSVTSTTLPPAGPSSCVATAAAGGSNGCHSSHGAVACDSLSEESSTASESGPSAPGPSRRVVAASPFAAAAAAASEAVGSQGASGSCVPAAPIPARFLCPLASCPTTLLAKQRSGAARRPAAIGFPSAAPCDQQPGYEAAAAAAAPGRRSGLPRLQELWLRHCSFEGIGLDDLVTHPEVSSCFPTLHNLG
jgi:hypothetical protein